MCTGPSMLPLRRLCFCWGWPTGLFLQRGAGEGEGEVVAAPGGQGGSIQSQKVVIKMLKKESVESPVARREFEMELNLLVRLDSPHTIRILGAGKAPRPFMVLEWLSKGTLSAHLSQNKSVSEFFRRPPFNKATLLRNVQSLDTSLHKKRSSAKQAGGQPHDH